MSGCTRMSSDAYTELQVLFLLRYPDSTVFDRVESVLEGGDIWALSFVLLLHASDFIFARPFEAAFGRRAKHGNLDGRCERCSTDQAGRPIRCLGRRCDSKYS